MLFRHKEELVGKCTVILFFMCKLFQYLVLKVSCYMHYILLLTSHGIVLQIPIQAGVLQVQFYWPYVYTTSSNPKYAGIDDVTLMNGTCPPIG